MSGVHAKSRPPSAALRWLNCTASVDVVPLYPNDPSAASEKGDTVHAALEDGIKFGILPDTDDPDADMNVRDVLEWVAKKKAEYGPDCKVFAEQQYDIAETGEFGTCDVTFVSPTITHIADYKNGYVMTEAYEQLMMYLLGAIQKYGAKSHYYITVIQPNYNHRDGPYRTTHVTTQDVADFSERVAAAVKYPFFEAGSHCKKTYCPHRGGCATFKVWAETEGVDAYYSHEINSISDEALAKALDHSDTLHGIRDEHRKEAMRRISQHDRKIPGYKLVKSRQNRDFAGEAGREACYRALLALGYEAQHLYETKEFKAGALSLTERTALAVPGVERMVKQKCKVFGNGKWKQVWEEHFRPHIREYSGSLTLERETDGRPAVTRGSEFGSLVPAQSSVRVQV